MILWVVSPSSITSRNNYHFDSSATLCIICMIPCHREGQNLLLMKGGHGIFKVGHDLKAYCAHKGETGTDESAQVLTRKD